MDESQSKLLYLFLALIGVVVLVAIFSPCKDKSKDGVSFPNQGIGRGALMKNTQSPPPAQPASNGQKKAHMGPKKPHGAAHRRRAEKFESPDEIYSEHCDNAHNRALGRY